MKILRITTFVYLVSCFSSCYTIEPVSVKRLDDFQVKTLSTKPAIHFNAVLYNPNSFGITLRSFMCEVKLGGKQISRIETSRKVQIASNADVSIPLEASPDLKDVTGMILGGTQVSDWKAEGNLVVSKFIFRRKIPFSVKGRL
jgi:LEA14-like dessication related protein